MWKPASITKMMNVKQLPLPYRAPEHAAKKTQNVKHSNANNERKSVGSLPTDFLSFNYFLSFNAHLAFICAHLRFFLFYFKNQPQNTCQQFRTFKNNDFHHTLPFQQRLFTWKKTALIRPTRLKPRQPRKVKIAENKTSIKKWQTPIRLQSYKAAFWDFFRSRNSSSI